MVMQRSIWRGRRNRCRADSCRRRGVGRKPRSASARRSPKRSRSCRSTSASTPASSRSTASISRSARSPATPRMQQALTADSHRHRARRRAGACLHRQGRADEGGRRHGRRAAHHHAGGAQGRPDQDRRRPQGQEGQRLDRRLADLLAGAARRRARQGWGPDGIDIAPIGAVGGADRGAEAPPDRRRDHRQRHASRARRRPADGRILVRSATASRISTSTSSTRPTS